MSYEITFGGRFQAGLNITTGKVVVKAGSLYLPATTANVALYPIAGLVVRYQQVPSANYDVGDIAHAGVWPSSVTGLTAATAGVTTYARLTSSGGLENTIAPAAGDWILGRINSDGDLILTGAYEYAVSSNTGPYVIKTLEDYGAVGDGVTDDTVAIQLAFDSIGDDSTDRLVAGVGPYLISDTIEINPIATASPAYKFVFEGQVDGTSIAPGHATFLWNGVDHTGAAASLATAGAADIGSADAEQSGQSWNYMLVTGLTGVTTAWVGKLLKLTGAATRAHNARHMIVKYVSSTSVRIAVMGSALSTDANNGSISWRLLRPAFKVSARGSIFRNFQLYPNNTTRGLDSVFWVTHPEHGNGFTVTRNIYQNIFACDANSSHISRFMVVGALSLPDDPAHPFYVEDTASDYLRPASMYQQDYQWIYDCTLQGNGGSYGYEGCFLSCPNTSGQVRSIYVEKCGASYRENFFSGRGDFGADTSTMTFDGKGGSFGGVFDRCTGAQITEAQFYVEAPQAPIEIRYHDAEGYSRLLDVRNATAAVMSISIIGGYINPGSAGVSPFDADSSGVITLKGACSIAIRDVALWYQESPFDGGQFIDSASSSEQWVTLDGCIVPSELQFGYDAADWHRIFRSSGANLHVNIKNCQKYTSGDANFVSVADQKLVVGGYAATPVGDPKTRLLVGGLSNSLFNASNFATTLTFSGTETVKVWPFTYPEQDENFAGHYYEVVCTPIAYTGSPAATLARVRPSTGKARVGVVIEMPTAPGGGATVTFLCMLVRHNASALTAFHPLQVAGLTHWYDAEYDWQYTIPANKQLNDPGPGAPGQLGYWRSQATTRGLNGNISVYDLQAHNNLSANMPALRERDAGYNNKYVVKPTAGDLLTVQTTASYPTQANPCWCLIAGHPGGGSGSKVASELYAANGGGYDGAFIGVNGTSTVGVYCGSTTPPTPDGFTYAYNWNAKEVVLAVFNGASSALYLSAKTAVATGTTGTIATGSSGSVTACDHIFQNQPWAGSSGTNALQTVMWGSGTLTTAEKDGLLDWVGAYVGKSIGA